MHYARRIPAAISLAALAIVLFPAAAHAQGGGGQGGQRRAGGAEPIPSIEERTNGLKKIDGFFPLYLDEAAGKLWLEIPKLDTEVLYSTGLATGLGSNDIGLDRGMLTGSRIVKFERAGPRVLMVQPNYQFRALTTNAAEARTVRDAFARSVLWGFPIAAATGERLLVDFTEFLVRDGNDMAGRLRPGTYRFDATRSSLYLPMTQGFPKNTEMEAELTFVRQPGAAAGRRRARRRTWRRRRRGVLRGRRQRRGERRSGQHPHPSLDRRAAGRQLQAAPVRSALRIRRPRIRELRGAARPADDAALPPPASPAEEGSVGRRQRSGQADRLLPRPRRAGADPIGAARRRALVEPGVRSRRLSQRVPRRAAARRREPARHPLQRDQLGASLDARLEHRRQRHRSAHRRDHQGRRDARIAAHPAGLHDRGRAAQPVQGGHRDAEGAAWSGGSRASVSSRRTKSATRSASATTTTTARRGASR